MFGWRLESHLRVRIPQVCVEQQLSHYRKPNPYTLPNLEHKPAYLSVYVPFNVSRSYFHSFYLELDTSKLDTISIEEAVKR